MGLGKNEPVDVLIVGAGPAGLMMACQLDLHHISFRIIDKKASPDIHSGALIVHARTLEILHQMGLAEKAMDAGSIAQTINLQFNQRTNYSLELMDVGKDSTRFPYLLMLEQWQTENLLSQFLIERGHEIENNTTFLAFTQEGEMIHSQILKSDGSIEFIKSRYLIGADGSNSPIRTQLNIPFPGKTQQSRLFITDCEARLKLAAREIFFSFASDYTSGLFPLPNNRWRVDGHIPLIQHKEVGFEDVRNFFTNKLHSGLELDHPKWFSVFRSHSRCAGMYRKNRSFLIGDSAHVHSPVGAQGMNTGLQDAHNLAWKLDFVIHGKASEKLLDTYETERRPLALRIIHHTDLAYSLMTANSFLIKFLRLKVFPLFLPLFLTWCRSKPEIQKRIFISISGLGIKYKRGFFSNSSSNSFSDPSPKPGERIPHLTYELNGNQVAIYDGLSSFQLLIFGKQNLPAPFQTVINKYSDVISVIHIAKNANNQPVFKRLGLKEQGCYLIRPDYYIAWRSQEFNAIDLGTLLKMLQKFML